MKKYIKSLIVVLFFAVSAMSYTQQKVLLDKVFATVGDKIILRSDIYNKISDLQRQGVETNTNTQCLLLEQEIIQKAMMMQAEKDSLLVTDEEVEAEIENRIRQFMAMYGGKDELEQIAGKNIFQLKEYFKNPIKEGLLARNMQKKIIENVKVTPLEIKNFFESIPKDSLEFLETEFQIGEVVMYVKSSKEDEEFAIESLKEIKDKIEKGVAKFDIQAQLYSDDPGSKNNGGRYEINKNEKQWDPVFLSTAFRLKEGEISSVVRSKFGYHIIQMVSKSGSDAVVRHILKIPPIVESDVQPTKIKIDSVRQLLIDKKISFGQAVATYSEDENSKFTSGLIMGPSQNTNLAIDQIDKDLIGYVSNLEVGEVSQTIDFTDPRGRRGLKFLYLKSKTQPHRENLTDDYLKIGQKLLEKRKLEIIDNWTNKYIPSFYLNVEPSLQTCSTNISKWKKESDNLGVGF